MLFLSVSVFGQKQKEVTFDFSNPSYLNLSGDGDINLNSSEFTKGQIKMSFDRLPNSFGVYYNNNNEQCQHSDSSSSLQVFLVLLPIQLSKQWDDLVNIW